MTLNFYILTGLYLGTFGVIITIAWVMADRYDKRNKK